MEQIVRKPESLSRLSGDERPGSSSEADGFALQEYFDGWLNSVRPSLPDRPKVTARKSSRHAERRPVTIRDLTRVDRETVRESQFHRPWPREVVERFLAASVIKRK